MMEMLFTEGLADYTIPINEERISVFVVSSLHFESKMFAVFGLIDWSLWFQVFAALSIVILVIYLIHYWIISSANMSVDQMFRNLLKAIPHLMTGGLTFKSNI